MELPYKTDIIDCYFKKTNMMYATHLSMGSETAYIFNENMKSFLKREGYSNTFVKVVSSLYMIKFGLMDFFSVTTTQVRRDQIAYIATIDNFRVTSGKSEYNCKYSVYIHSNG